MHCERQAGSRLRHRGMPRPRPTPAEGTLPQLSTEETRPQGDAGRPATPPPPSPPRGAGWDDPAYPRPRRARRRAHSTHRSNPGAVPSHDPGPGTSPGGVAAPAPDKLIQVYSIGNGFNSEELLELEECLAALHASPHIAETVRSIRERAAHYLTPVRTPATGWGLVASREIPPEVDICVYSGEIRKKGATIGSNHRIDLGPLLSTFMEVDGSLADPSAAPPGAMQLVNHVCAVQPGQGGTGTGARRPHAGPNCVARHEMTDDLVGLLILRTSRAVPPGQQLSFDYDEREIGRAHV